MTYVSFGFIPYDFVIREGKDPKDGFPLVLSDDPKAISVTSYSMKGAGM